MTELPRRLLVLAVLALAGLFGSAMVFNGKTVLAGYLAAVVAVTAIPIGALNVLMITYLVSGPWTEQLHRPLTAAASTMPLAGLLFIPVLIGMGVIYPWLHEAPGVADSLAAFYLVPWFFAVRTIVYFIVWTGLARWLLSAWPDRIAMTRAASVGLIVHALIGSFAGIDWLESVTPDFHSSIYGLLFLTFQMLTGLAWALAVYLWRADARPRSIHAGPILLAAILLWAYNHAMQYIILWSGNIPDEVFWYLTRSSGGWGIVLVLVSVVQFVAPFFILLSSSARDSRTVLLVIVSGTLVCRVLEACWLILPGLHVHALGLLVSLPLALAATGLLWLAACQVAWSRMPSRDPMTAPTAASG